MVTLEEIANEVGVSARTISNVLNGKNKENWGSTATRAQYIREVAARMGYMPNGAAKATATGRFGCIALLLSTTGNRSSLPLPVWRGLHDELAYAGHHLSLFQLPDAELVDEQKMPKILREWMADGMVVDYTHQIPARFVQLIEEHDIPAVWLNCDREQGTVRPDDIGAAQMATRKLLELGHRHITYVDFHGLSGLEGVHYSSVHRAEGYRRSMETAGLLAEIVTGASVQSARPFEFLRTVLERPVAPTAFVCYGDEDAAHVLFAARLAGREVPRDLSLVTFGAAPLFALSYELSHCIIPEYEMGRHAARAILQKTSGSPESKRQEALTELPFTWNEGATIAGCP